MSEHIRSGIASLTVGRWILVDEEGIVPDLTETEYSFSTKKDAIADYGARMLDIRRVPKVQRLAAGHYWYYTKNCDSGHDNSPVNVVKLTPQNLEKYRDMLRAELAPVLMKEIKNETLD